jgi:hypothetical protein
MNHAAAACSKSTPPPPADFDERGGRFFCGIYALYARKLAFKTYADGKFIGTVVEVARAAAAEIFSEMSELENRICLQLHLARARDYPKRGITNNLASRTS